MKMPNSNKESNNISQRYASELFHDDIDRDFEIKDLKQDHEQNCRNRQGR